MERRLKEADTAVILLMLNSECGIIKYESFNTAVLALRYVKAFVLYKYFVIAVRVSGGHLAEQKGTAERQARPPSGARQSAPLSLRGALARGNPFFFKGDYGFFHAPRLRMTNRLVISTTANTRQSVFSPQ